MKSILLIVSLLVLNTSVFAGELRSVSSIEFFWVDNGQTAATVSKTEIGDWKVKHISGFYIGLITKRGDVLQFGSGPTVDNVPTVNAVEILISIQKALIPYLSK